MLSRKQIVEEVEFALRQSIYITTYETDPTHYEKCAREIVDNLVALGVFKRDEVQSSNQPPLQQADVGRSAGIQCSCDWTPMGTRIRNAFCSIHGI